MDLTSRTPEMIEKLKLLVETGSPTHDKEAVNRVGEIMAREAKNLGAKIETIPKTDFGDQIIARWGEGPGGILLIGHIDTVFPLGILSKMPFHEADGKIFGPGRFSDRSGKPA